MTSLSWHDLNANKDYDYAFEEILHYCYTMEMDGAQRAALALILGQAASGCMDYDDYTDFKRSLDMDPEKNRITRLANFQDYIIDYAQKRLVLTEEKDPFLEKKRSKYQSTRTTVRVLEGRGINPERSGQLPLDDIESLIDELCENLIIQGVKRLPLARAFVDAAFLYASLSGSDVYKQICMHVIAEAGVNMHKASSEIRSLSDTHRRVQIANAEASMQDILGSYGAFESATIH